MDTGTAMAGISVERKSCKKTKTTKNTSRNASINVIKTLSMDAVRNKLESIGIEILIPLGKLFVIPSKETLMFLIISWAFDPLVCKTPINTAGWPKAIAPVV